MKSGAAIQQFRYLFMPSLDQALVVEWKMPQNPYGMSAPGFVGQLVSFYNSFRFPGFIIERSDETNSQGKVIYKEISSLSVNKNTASIIERNSFPAPKSRAAVREQNGTVYKDFDYKWTVDFGANFEGVLTGTYKYIDRFNLEPGKVYYYRVRAFFGDVSKYAVEPKALSAKMSLPSNMIKQNGNSFVVNFGNGVTLGKPSGVVRGFVPRTAGSDGAFDMYNDIFNAVCAALLLNFELPAGSTNNSTRRDQMTGWGTLEVLAGQIGGLKAAFPTSAEMRTGTSGKIEADTWNLFFRASARRLTNTVLEELYRNPQLVDMLSSRWQIVRPTVDQILSNSTEKISWKLYGLVSNSSSVTPGTKIDPTTGLSTGQPTDLEKYLSAEDSYPVTSEDIPGITERIFEGPYPLKWIGVEARQDLAEFLRMALCCLASNRGYLSWYSITVGDLFPVLVPFLFDFEQWILSLLKAVESLLKEITDIIETLLQRIRALEQILKTILALIDLLNINVSVSMLGFVGQGSADTLVDVLMSSENKPGSQKDPATGLELPPPPYGLHSGMVLTAGGPGVGFIAAIKAIEFILTGGQAGG
jgi:hypothetical protein